MKTRVEVVRFCADMEATLQANDFKGGWKENKAKDDIWWFFDRLVDEVDELRRAIAGEDSDRIAAESIDVGNFACMIHDLRRNTNAVSLERPTPISLSGPILSEDQWGTSREQYPSNVESSSVCSRA